jgi:CRP/FNR family transcriptional regulator, cyclic AMP receptor protein
MPGLLDLTDHLPATTVAAGEVVIAEGAPSGRLVVLVDGVLEIRKGDQLIRSIDTPGACVGEIGLLTGVPATASVVAAAPTTVRTAADGHALVREQPEVLAEVARILAVRLHEMTTYLADLKHQYGDAPGLRMVDDVLGRLTQGTGAVARPGSARDPDPLY